MADRFVDDGGNNSDGLTWAKAYTSVQSLQTAEATFMTTSGNRVIIGADSNCTDAGAALTIVGPTSGLPVIFISSTVSGTADIAYSVGTGKQIDTDSGAYAVTFDGSFALYGIKVASGAGIDTSSDANETMYLDGCTFAPGANGMVTFTGGAATWISARNITFDLTADGTSARTGAVWKAGTISGSFRNISFTGSGVAYRTGAVMDIGGTQSAIDISGMDCSGFTNATMCEIVSIQSNCAGGISLSNIKTKSGGVLFNSNLPSAQGWVMFTNSGAADAPVAMAFRSYFGDVVSSSSIYRSGGATVEGEACGWLITTNAICGEGAPLYTPWMYGTTTAGAKTFTVHCSCNNSAPTTATLQDDEIWLEVEYLATSDIATWTLATDQRATITTAAADQTVETASTWVGLNDSGQDFADFRFMLEVPIAVGETGQFRCRVAVAVASVTSASYLYCDPKPIVADA